MGYWELINFARHVANDVSSAPSAWPQRPPDYTFTVAAVGDLADVQVTVYTNRKDGSHFIAFGGGVAAPGGGMAGGVGWVGSPWDSHIHNSGSQVAAFISGATAEASAAHIGYGSIVYSASTDQVGYQIGAGNIERSAAINDSYAWPLPLVG